MSPQEVSLTTFMDFMLKSGTPRVTCVNDAIARYDDDYEPAFDYWKQFRDAVAAMHRLGRDKSTLDEVLQRVGEHKRDNYAKAGREYKRFLGRKRVAWSEPPRAVWSAAGLRVRVNPELGLNIDGERYAIKLHTRANQNVRAVQVRAMLRLMATSVKPAGEWNPMVLNVMSGRAYTKGADDSRLDALLQGEAAAFVTMWRQAAA